MNYTAKTQKDRKIANRKTAKNSLRTLRCKTAKAQKIYFAILRLRLCGFLRLCGVKRSFTLMELLIAVSIFAVIALCLYSVFSGGIQIWKRQEKGFVYNHTVRLAFDTMAKELRNAINYSQPENPSLPAADAQKLKFTGDEEHLTFMTLIGGEIAKVDYVFEEASDKRGRLIRKIVFQKEGFKEENQKDNVLIEGLKGLTFEYAYRSDSDEPPYVWKDSWAKEAQDKKSKIPIGVRITLVFPGSGRRQEEIFRKTVFIPTGTLEKYEGL